MSTKQTEYQKQFEDYFRRLVEATATLPEEERKALEEWEAENVGKPNGLATSDWPGWVKYIGDPPWKNRPV
jgi:hypothetical protein